MKHITNEQAQKLEQVAGELAALRGVPGAEGVCMAKQTELITLLYTHIFDAEKNQGMGVVSESEQREHDAFCLFLEGDLHKFDPAKSPFMSFFLSRMQKRKLDALRGEKPVFRSEEQPEDEETPEGEAQGVPEGEAQEAKRPKSKKPAVVSYDVNVGDDDSSATLGDLLPDPTGGRGQQEERIAINDALLALVTLLLHPVDLGSERREYYRLFFTDFMADYLSETQGAEEVFRRRERDVFASVSVPFLDFFMVEKCRSIDEICRTGRRTHGEMVEGKDRGAAVGFRMPADVYITYRKAAGEGASDAAISTHTGNFYRWFGELLRDKAGYEGAMQEKLTQTGSASGKAGRPKTAK